MNELPAINHNLKARLGDPDYEQQAQVAFNEDDLTTYSVYSRLLGEDMPPEPQGSTAPERWERMIQANRLKNLEKGKEKKEDITEEEYSTPSSNMALSPPNPATSILETHRYSSAISDPEVTTTTLISPGSSIVAEPIDAAAEAQSWRMNPTGVSFSDLSREAVNIIMAELLMQNASLQGELTIMKLRVTKLTVRVSQLEAKDTQERAAVNRRSNTMTTPTRQTFGSSASDPVITVVQPVNPSAPGISGQSGAKPIKVPKSRRQ